MSLPLTEAEAGRNHNAMVVMAGDTVLRISMLPQLMLAMLESDGWRRLQRPLDRRIFENHTIEDWILGEPWPGLHFPNWATLYAMLDKNIEVGAKCIMRLLQAGAPTPAQAEVAFRAQAVREGAVIQSTGRPKKGIKLIPLSKSGDDPSRLAARLKRNHPEMFAALERGEYRTVRAAAKAAGMIRDKTPLEQLRHWWAKASPQERQGFLRFLRADAESTESTGTSVV